jgi:hypothetical protein
MLETILCWLHKYESLAIWLEGIALVAIFVLDWRNRADQRRDREEQHEETVAQLKVSQAQADAIMNSERAWVMAELIPICEKFNDGYWRRRVGNGWTTLSEEEIVKGDYLRHRLKFTNMGKTPAHVLRYHIGYSREVDVTGTDLRMIDTVKHPEIVFDRLLSGNDSIEVQDVDVSQYIRDSIEAIGDSEAAGILSGWVEYQHVFSDTDVVKIPFLYLYDPSKQRLTRVPLQKSERGEKQSLSR